MSTSEVKATKQFQHDFMLVANHYMLAELGELETAKQAARNDMAAAEVCYASLAAEIRGADNTAHHGKLGVVKALGLGHAAILPKSTP